MIRTRQDSPDLYYRAFVHTLLPVIVGTSSGRIVMANKAACRLLGYSVTEVMRKRIFSVLRLKFREFKELQSSSAQLKLFNHGFGIAVKDGKLLDCLRNVSFFQDSAGDIKTIVSLRDLRLIRPGRKSAETATLSPLLGGSVAVGEGSQMLVELAESNERLAANSEWKKCTGKTSYDVMWDWNITSNEFEVGDSVQEVFGYKTKDKVITISDFNNAILPEEKRRIKIKLSRALATGKKSWKDSFMLRRNNGTIAFTTSRAQIVRDDGGKAIHLIGATQDVSKLHELEQRLQDQEDLHQELNEVFEAASKLSFDGRWDWNLLTNEFFFGPGFEELFGYNVNDSRNNVSSDWSGYIHADDRKMVEAGLQKAIKSVAKQWEQAYRFVRQDGTYAEVVNRVTILRNAYGKATRIIGVMQDVSKQRVLEDALAQEIKLKEKKIEEAKEEAVEAERADIGKELHDNINQLLSASKLYIDLARRGGMDRESFLNKSSQYTMSAIEEIRKLTKGLTTDILRNFGLSEAIENLARETMKLSRMHIYCKLDSGEADFEEKLKLNAYRIVQEQLNNILKHAKASRVTITLRILKSVLHLEIADNGIGFDVSKERTGIGVDNINSRAKAFGGTAEFASSPGLGCTLTVAMPIEVEKAG